MEKRKKILITSVSPPSDPTLCWSSVHPFTIQNCCIENLACHVFHSKITPALQARSCWDIFFLISGDWRFYTKQWHHQAFLYRMSEKKKSQWRVPSPLQFVFHVCVIVLQAVGIVGAVIMPHNMYLHSALVKVGTCTVHVIYCVYSFVQHIPFVHQTYCPVHVKETGFDRLYQDNSIKYMFV